LEPVYLFPCGGCCRVMFISISSDTWIARGGYPFDSILISITLFHTDPIFSNPGQSGPYRSANPEEFPAVVGACRGWSGRHRCEKLTRNGILQMSINEHLRVDLPFPSYMFSRLK
jgi:hypothetical protein